MKTGMRVRIPGSITVESTSMNRVLRNGKRKYTTAKALSRCRGTAGLSTFIGTSPRRIRAPS